MDDNKNVKIARDWLEAFNQGNWSAVAAGLAPTSVYEEFGTQRHIEGRDAIVSVYQTWKKAMPDVKGHIHNTLSGGDSVALEVTWEGTQTSPLETPDRVLAASGRRQKTPGVFALEIQDGKIVSSRNYFDMLTFLQQIDGAPVATG